MLYTLLVGVPALALAAILFFGRGLEAPAAVDNASPTASRIAHPPCEPPAASDVTADAAAAQAAAAAAAAPAAPCVAPFGADSFPAALALLLLQIAVIIVAARTTGMVFRRLRQPQVVGEMAAGILLGPSLLGWAAPGVSAALFPEASLALLGALSTVGVLLFMFLVGLDFDAALVRGRATTAVVTSHVSIAAPFVLGAALALLLYAPLAGAGVPFTGFALFLGAAMSVTAFPVLARILSERKLLSTRLGAVAIACAAVDDVTAWIILAVAITVVRAEGAASIVWMLTGTAAYLIVMLRLVRPLLARAVTRFGSSPRFDPAFVAAALALLALSAWATERLGIHALFGAFAAGAVLPRSTLVVHALAGRLRYVVVVVLLPLFFAHTGLRTSIGLVDGAELWLYAGLVLAVAVAGKFGGTSIAARLTGLSWPEARALGVLMNTRGLMELIILTIGLELGVLSPPLFAMLVLMALVTTAMTTPMLEWLHPAASDDAGRPTRPALPVHAAEEADDRAAHAESAPRPAVRAAFNRT